MSYVVHARCCSLLCYPLILCFLSALCLVGFSNLATASNVESSLASSSKCTTSVLLCDFTLLRIYCCVVLNFCTCVLHGSLCSYMVINFCAKYQNRHMKVSPLFPFKAVLRDPRSAGHDFPSWEPLLIGRWEPQQKRASYLTYHTVSPLFP